MWVNATTNIGEAGAPVVAITEGAVGVAAVVDRRSPHAEMAEAAMTAAARYRVPMPHRVAGVWLCMRFLR